MRASLFKRKPLSPLKPFQRLISSSGTTTSYTLTVDSLSTPATANDITLTFTGNYVLPVDSLTLTPSLQNVNLIWVGAPISPAKSSTMSLSMRIGL